MTDSQGSHAPLDEALKAAISDITVPPGELLIGTGKYEKWALLTMKRHLAGLLVSDTAPLRYDTLRMVRTSFAAMPADASWTRDQVVAAIDATCAGLEVTTPRCPHGVWKADHCWSCNPSGAEKEIPTGDLPKPRCVAERSGGKDG